MAGSLLKFFDAGARKGVRTNGRTQGSGYLASATAFRELLPDLISKHGVPAVDFGIEQATFQPEMIVVLTPWHGCPVSLFSVVIGLCVAQRKRYDVHFLIDDIAYPQESKIFQSELQAISYVTPVLKSFFRVTRLSELETRSDSSSIGLVEQTASRALELDIEHRIGHRLRPSEDFISSGKRNLIAKGLRIATLFERSPWAAVLVPGGLVNGSWIYLGLAKHYGIRCPAFDSGAGLLLVSTDGVASHQADIAHTYHHLLKAAAEEREFALGRAREILAKRENGGDEIMPVKFQNNEMGVFDVVLCMNFEGDTAAIGLDHIFSSARDWLETTVIEVSKRRPGTRIAIRQHPDERRLEAYQSADALSRVRELAAQGLPVHVFAADNDTSTYQLSRGAKAVIVGTSTFGIEAATLGKPVIVSREVYYSGADFVSKPKSRDEYIELILEALDSPKRIADARISHASLMYYILEDCNRVRSKLTPQPADFRNWLAHEPLSILDDDDFQMVISAINGENAYSLLKHQSLWMTAQAALLRGVN